MDYKWEEGETLGGDVVVKGSEDIAEQTFVQNIGDLFIELRENYNNANKTKEKEILYKIGNSFRVWQPFYESFNSCKINEIYEKVIEETEISVSSALLFSLANILRPTNIEYCKHFNKISLASAFIHLLSNASLLNKYVFNILANNKDLADYIFSGMPIDIISENYSCFIQTEDDPLGVKTSSIVHFLITALYENENNKELTDKMLSIINSLIELADANTKFLRKIVKLVYFVVLKSNFFNELEPKYDIVSKIWSALGSLEGSKYFYYGLVILSNANSYDFIDKIEILIKSFNSDSKTVRICSYFLLSKLVIKRNEFIPAIIDLGIFDKIYEQDSYDTQEYEELYLLAIVVLRFCDFDLIIELVRKGLFSIMVNFLGDSDFCQDTLQTLVVIINHLVTQLSFEEALSICDEVDLRDSIQDVLFSENEEISKTANNIWKTMSGDRDE